MRLIGTLGKMFPYKINECRNLPLRIKQMINYLMHLEQVLYFRYPITDKSCGWHCSHSRVSKMRNVHVPHIRSWTCSKTCLLTGWLEMFIWTSGMTTPLLVAVTRMHPPKTERSNVEWYKQPWGESWTLDLHPVFFFFCVCGSWSLSFLLAFGVAGAFLASSGVSRSAAHSC